MADKWIQGAVKHPGAFSAKAKRAGESTSAYASEKAHAPGTLGRQARLAKTLMGMPKHGDGAVVAPTESPWEKLWKIITGKSANEALAKAANPTAPPPMSQGADDISVVRRAAEEAGKRNEEAKSAQMPVKKYGCGGVVGYRR